MPADAPVMIAWTLALLTVVALVFLAIRRERRKSAFREDRLERSPQHEVQIRAIRDWLSDEKVVRVLLSKRLANMESLDGINRALDHWTEDDVRAAVVVILRDRDVRRAIAAYMERTRPNCRGKQADIMRDLLRWAQPAAGATEVSA